MIGIVKVARSDWGHTRGLYEALKDQAIIIDWKDDKAPWHTLSKVIILGDRWEMAQAAVTAVYLRVPIIHLHGGEYTPNVIDNAYRNAISQMASVHCVAHPVHRDRLICMGIDPATIHVTGAPGLDRYAMSPISREAVAKTLKLDIAQPWAMVLLHPTTLRPQDASDEWHDTNVAIGGRQPVFFTPGNDPGASELRQRMEAYVYRYAWARLVTDLEEAVWVGLLQHTDVVIGNSSTLVTDCPFLGKRTIEIGRRQEDRDRVPYGDGKSVPRIVEILT